VSTAAVRATKSSKSPTRVDERSEVQARPAENAQHFPQRVAALYDVHGNVPALDAVLDDVGRAGADLIVFGGDLVAGPWPRETITRARAFPNARFVLGNADRPDSSHPGAAWLWEQLDDDETRFLRSFEEQVVLDGVRYRHGSPRSVDEIVTPLTPEPLLREMLDGVEESTVVVGHTHVQFDRSIGRHRIVNAGSVGMAYEGRRGAFWALIEQDIELRHTDYDVERTAAELPPDYPNRDDLIGWLLDPPDPGEVATYFEEQAGR
jgi:predicted phosphodiesterase